MSLKSSLRTSGPSSSKRVFVLLSGEASTLPEAEARALIASHDPEAEVERAEERVLIGKTVADPWSIGRRIAFSRRVGELIPEGGMPEVAEMLGRSTFRVKIFNLRGPAHPDSERAVIERVAGRIAGKVDLETPEYEITAVLGNSGDYLVLTRPAEMKQDWVRRRPRGRPFFHPAALFPKISRGLVNLSGVSEGGTLLDPFAGTGSILLEAERVGVEAIGMDVSRKMARGAQRNERWFGEGWLGMVLADSRMIPVTSVDAIATDVPYGRVSSTEGSPAKEILAGLIDESRRLLRRGGKVVVMHPEDSPVEAREGFYVEGEHLTYVHRKLTRAITVLRRS